MLLCFSALCKYLKMGSQPTGLYRRQRWHSGRPITITVRLKVKWRICLTVLFKVSSSCTKEETTWAADLRWLCVRLKAWRHFKFRSWTGVSVSWWIFRKQATFLGLSVGGCHLTSPTCRWPSGVNGRSVTRGFWLLLDCSRTQREMSLEWICELHLTGLKLRGWWQWQRRWRLIALKEKKGRERKQERKGSPMVFVCQKL